jgi:hypothetical protein
VDSVCCSATSCGTCQSYAATAAPGHCAPVEGADPDSCTNSNCAAGVCLKTAGQACSDGAECPTTQCSKGYCCNSACDEPCGECSTGLCSPMQASSTVNACGAYSCDGLTTTCPADRSAAPCNPGFSCAPGSNLCLVAADCASGFCSDGVCCESACDGLCESCGVAAGSGQDGQCDPAPQGTEEACPYGCSGTERACGKPPPCSSGAECDSEICIDGRSGVTLFDCGTECSQDGRSQIDSESAVTIPCEFGCHYGRCAKQRLDCRLAQDCAKGEICTTEGVCAKSGVAAEGSPITPDSPLGCLCTAVGRRGTTGHLGLVAMGAALGLLLLHRRRGNAGNAGRTQGEGQ